MCCVLWLDGMSVVVNVVLYLMSVMNFGQTIGAHVGEVMYFGSY